MLVEYLVAAYGFCTQTERRAMMEGVKTKHVVESIVLHVLADILLLNLCIEFDDCKWFELDAQV